LIGIAILLAFLPVTLFLVGLLYLDSYKLVPLPRIVQLIVIGSVIAAGSFVLNQGLRANGVDPRMLRRFAGPAVEETLKAIPVLLLLRRRRIGFLIDAAICGFAVGAGFALAENVYYLSALHNTHPSLWVVRGFGTAMMHGGTTAIVAMTTKVLSDRKGSDAAVLAVPGILLGFLLHSLFNHFVLSPAMSAVVIVLVLPPLMVAVFSQSEHYLQQWLGSGFDLESELLQTIGSGDFAQSRPGHYLQSLRDHFDGPVVADMLCYLRLRAELSLRAKGVLMLRENGLPVKRDEDTAGKLAELRYLEQSIGKTGKLALAPILHHSRHDFWQLQMLESGK
jgi:RsiW-degrading membrane proteinase PrsW (M82 family)